jgi:3-hydroxyacyl-CoA dehydrogenase
MNYKKIVVAGGGVLGSQIAYQAAYSGKEVTIWLRSEGSIGRTKPKLEALKEEYAKALALMNETKGKVPEAWCRGLAVDEKDFNYEECLAKSEAAFKNIKLELDLAKACKGADLIIESMAEIQNEKTAFYKKLAGVLDEKTVIVTNSSTLLPSSFAKVTGRASKYCSLHFANHIWKQNLAEVMAQDETDPNVFADVMEFAREIKMIPVPVLKEKAGYLLNSLLVPFLLCGMDLVANGVSDPESVDKAWKLGTGAPRGPFEIIDVVGITTAYNIIEKYQSVPGLVKPLLKKMMMPYNFKAISKMLKEKIDAGKLGKAAGEGFYVYKK